MSSKRALTRHFDGFIIKKGGMHQGALNSLKTHFVTGTGCVNILVGKTFGHENTTN